MKHMIPASRTHARPGSRHAFLLRLPALLLVAAMLFLTAGCMSQLKQPPLDKKFYEIRTAKPGTPGPAVMNMPLRVRRLNISPSYSGRELVFRTGENTFDSDFYNLFFIPPADMLSQDLGNRLKNEHIFSHVVDPASLVETRYTLEGMIIVLYGDYTTKPGTAVVSMQFFLLDEKKTEKSILFSADYDRRVPIASNTAEGLVTGMNQAVDSIYSALAEDLKRFVQTEKQHAQEGN